MYTKVDETAFCKPQPLKDDEIPKDDQELGQDHLVMWCILSGDSLNDLRLTMRLNKRFNMFCLGRCENSPTAPCRILRFRRRFAHN